jgi:hypothetical protein
VALILLVTDEGLPHFVDWTSGTSCELPLTILSAHTTVPAQRESVENEAQTSTEIANGTSAESHAAASPNADNPDAASSFRDCAVLRVDACFHPRHRNVLFLVSNRHELLKLSFSFLDDGPDVPRVTGSVRVLMRVATAPTTLVPELTLSVHSDVLVATTLAGILIADSDTLREVPTAAPYVEPVESTPLSTARLVRRDTLLVALPHPRSGNMSGGAYIFRLGHPLESKLITGPYAGGGLVAAEAHPWLGAITFLTTAGDIYTLQQQMSSTPGVFPGPMYPPGFKLQVGSG